MAENKLYAGYGRTCITPEESTYLYGYPLETDRYHKEVKDDVYASCTAFRDSDGSTVLIYSLDLGDVPNPLADGTRKVISEEIGIPTANIVLNATHSHAAPDRLTPEYLAPLCVEAAKEAIADLAECELYTSVRELYSFNFCRRYLTKDGRLWDYGTRPVIHGFETEPDHNVYLVKIVREGKKDIILANFAAHADTIKGCEGKSYTLSADYPGSAREYFEKETGAYLSIHMGACGDLTATPTPAPFYTFAGTDIYGRFFGREIIEALRDVKKVNTGKVKATAKVFQIDVDHTRDGEVEECKKVIELWRKFEATQDPTEKAEAKKALDEQSRKLNLEQGATEAFAILRKANYPATLPMEFSAISIGDVAFAVAPYEMFNDTGMQIKAGSKFPMTFVCAYSNGFNFYIPTEKAFKHRGYEMVTCSYMPGAAEKVGESLIALLETI